MFIPTIFVYTPSVVSLTNVNLEYYFAEVIKIRLLTFSKKKERKDTTNADDIWQSPDDSVFLLC